MLILAGLSGFVAYDLRAGVSIGSIAWLILNGRITLALAAVATLFCVAGGPNVAAQQVTRTSVDFTYEVPFRFTGVIDKLTFNLGPRQWSELDRKTVEEMVARARD